MFTVIDMMHCLFLGVLRCLCRIIWGMDIKFDDGNRIEIDTPHEPAQGATEMKLVYARHILHNRSTADVHKLWQCVMLHLCEELDCLLQNNVTI